MTSRINWIDWAKFIAITMVVYDHIPVLQPGVYLSNYICIFHMPFFFFISGYLAKKRDFRGSIGKNWNSIIIPYFIYNLIFYPYWLVRMYVENQNSMSFFDYVIKPIFGIFFLQVETVYSTEVNGATWFLVVLLFMRIIYDLCYLTRHPLFYLTIIAFFSAFCYSLNLEYNFAKSLTFSSLFRCLPVYILGTIARYYNLFEKTTWAQDLALTIILMGISIITYAKYQESFIETSPSAYLYFMCITTSFGILFFTKTINSIKSTFIINISLGTIMIMGTHWMFIGTTNYILEKVLNLNEDIRYPFIVAIIFTIVIELLIYPFIIISKRKWPILLGKKSPID